MDNILLFLFGQLVTAAAIWGGIRVEIRNLHTKIDGVQKGVDEAHQRIDRHLERLDGR